VRVKSTLSWLRAKMQKTDRQLLHLYYAAQERGQWRETTNDARQT
jgi:hypothetical protein